MRKRSPEHWVLLAISPVGVLGLVVLHVLLDPDPRGFGTHEALGFSPCMPMERWGIPCPGCGVTTSTTLFAHGQWVDAFVTQPFGFLLAVIAVVFAIWAPLRHLRGHDMWKDLLTLNANRWGMTLIAIFVVAWLYKWVVI